VCAGGRAGGCVQHAAHDAPTALCVREPDACLYLHSQLPGQRTPPQCWAGVGPSPCPPLLNRLGKRMARQVTHLDLLIVHAVELLAHGAARVNVKLLREWGGREPMWGACWVCCGAQVCLALSCSTHKPHTPHALRNPRSHCD